MPSIHEHLDSGKNDTLEPIAICGMACHLPGAVNSASSLWDMLVKKRSGQTSKVPSSRFNIDAHFHHNLERPGSFNVLGGYFLDEDVANFDPTFFNMTPVETMWLDPQQRKILEVCYESLENAGLGLESIAGSNCAVFVGSFTADYQQMSTKDPDFRHNYAATGVDPGLISNRIGHVFNLNGPSFTVNTACSSSVYATHMACHALRARDCEAALVGGVNLILTVDQHMNTAKLGILSPTSTCHTFDATADGYGRAEGAGALYLKRLSDAIRDGNLVRGVLKSTAVNTNGKIPGMGITHPSILGQERVIRRAYERAHLDPNQTAYLECHGTGTPVGDPIEVQAVANAMNDTRSKEKPLILGAIKPNIGHSEAASGIFAIMKAALMTESGIIPGVCGLTNLNPAIHEVDWNVQVQESTVAWPTGFASKRASVSSFGYGGTNAHAIIEDVQASCPYYKHGTAKSKALYDHSTSRPLLIGFSAHDKTTLNRNIRAHASVANEFYLTDLAYTLNLRRTRFSHRAFTIAREGNEIADFDINAFKFGMANKKPRKLGFIFTGQGAQWAQMGAQAVHEFPDFRITIQALERVLKGCPNPPSWSLEEELLAPIEKSRLNSAELAQPALTAIQIAIVDLFASWNIFPSVSVGHSSGEGAAAYAAGLVSAPQAMLVAYYRGYALAHYGSSGGAMLAVGLNAAEAAEEILGLGQDVEIACENSPSSLTLSGTITAIARTKATLDAKSIFTRELRTSQAYHSSHMKVLASPFVHHFTIAFASLSEGELDWRQPISRMISSVTASEIREHDITGAYWAANLISRVRFNEAIALLGNTPGLEEVHSMIEIGPHSALVGPFKQICKENNFNHLSHISTLIRGSNCASSLLNTAGELFLQDYPVDLEVVNTTDQMTDEGLRIGKSLQPLALVDLPPYQWNYEKMHWTEPRLSHEQRHLTHARHDILGSRIVGLADRSPAWRNVLRQKDVPWLKDHSLGGSAIFPAAAHLALAIEALRQVCENKGVEVSGVTLRDVDIKTALVIPETDDGIEIQINLHGTQKENTNFSYHFTIESLLDRTWTLHCQGTVFPTPSPTELPKDVSHLPDLSRLTQRVPSKRWYEAFDRVGFAYGPTFQKLGPVRSNRWLQISAAEVNIVTKSGSMDGESRYIVHPSTVDACLQLIIISIHAGSHREMPWGVVPIGIEEVSFYFPEARTTSQGSAAAWTEESNGRYFDTNTRLLSSNGKLILDIRNLRCVAYEAAVPHNTQAKAVRQPYASVCWKPDISRLSSAQAIQVYPGIPSESGSIAWTIELIEHKQPIKNVLLLGYSPQDTPKTILESVPASATVASFTVSDLTTVEPSVFDLVIIAKRTFCGISIDTIFSRLEPLLAERSNLIFSVEDTFQHSCKHALVTAGFAPPWLQFDLPNASVILARLESFATISPCPMRTTLMTTDTGDAVLAQLLRTLSKNCDANIKHLKDYRASGDENVIVFDFQGSLLHDLNSETFESIKGLLCSGTPTMWMTAGVNKGNNALGGMVPGFLRTIRAEQTRAKIIWLNSVLPLDAGNDNEYWLHDGIDYISRIIPNEDLNSQLDTKSPSVPPLVLKPDVPLCGEVFNGEIIFSPTEIAALEPLEIGLQIDCFAIEGNAAQAFSAFPKLTAGTATKVGEGLASTLIGKKAITFLSKAFCTVSHVHASQCAWFTTTNVEGLMSNLPSLCSAVNAIGIQHLDSRQHIVLIKPSLPVADTYKALGLALGFPVSVVESCHEFRQSVLKDHRPVTIISYHFSALSQDIWRYIPSAGRFVLNESSAFAAPDPLPLTRGAAFVSTGLVFLHKSNTSLLQEVLSKSLELIDLYPGLLVQTSRVVSVDEASTVTEASSIVQFKYNKSSLKIRPSGKELRLSADANYLLIGCLGGLGRSLTNMMMERGARHFTFISRSGVYKPEAAALVKSLVEVGADVQVFEVDASNADDVTNVVSEISSVRPIKGVVHAAMVLQDAMFGHTMTLDMFNAATVPKVKGAQALDQVLRGHSLDFFILTSSVSGTIGNPGQANYSAANSYLDTFAWHRNLQGLPATSLVLPMILDVGVVAETDSLESKITRKGWYGIDEGEMLRGFETAMLQSTPQPGASVERSNSQIILGVEPQLFAHALAAVADYSDIYWLADARFAGVRRAIELLSKETSKKGGNGDFMSLLEQAPKEGGPDIVIGIIAEHIMKKCSSILMVSVEDFEVDNGSIASYGLDSMIGAELRNWLFKEFGLDMNFQLLLATTLTFKGLSILVGETLGIIKKAL